MLWILQNNMVEGMTGRLAWALRGSGRAMFDFSLVHDRALPDFPVAPDGALFFYGSTALLEKMRGSVWAAGVFGTPESLDQRVWADMMGNRMLNPLAEVMTLDQLRASAGARDFFIRPVVSHKAFSGHVVRSGDLSGLFQGRKGPREQPEDLLLAVSPVVEGIVAEYRFVVLHNKVRLGSRYRFDGKLSVSPEVPLDVLDAAQQLAYSELPAEFIVMDVAMLATGEARIVEFNPIHSSGIYAIDGVAFAEVVEDAVKLRLSA